MPTKEAVEDFVSLIEAGQTLQSMERYYADNASVRENMASPRTGKTALIKHEQEALASIRSLSAKCVSVRSKPHCRFASRMLSSEVLKRFG